LIPISRIRASTDAAPKYPRWETALLHIEGNRLNIVLPSLGDIEEVEVTEICVAVGDVVNADDSIIVIESDKASMEVPAGHQGTVTELHISVGDMLSEGAAIGTLTESASQPASHDDLVESEPEQALRDAVAARAGEQQTVQILVPDLGDIERVEVIEVAGQPGSSVSPGDLLVVLESDKASMEIPIEVSGMLLEINVAVGDQVSAGSLLAMAQVEMQPAPAGKQAAPPESVSQPMTTAKSGSDATPLQVATPVQPERSGGDATVYAGPATRRLAREIGVSLQQVSGSGNRGRITKDDVKAWAKAKLNQSASVPSSVGSALPALPAVDFAKFGSVEDVPLSRIQKQVAINMHRSWVNIPHVTQHAQADIDDLEAFRRSMKAEAQARGVKLSPLPFIIKAACHTLAAHPKLNGSVSADGENLVFKRYINVGIAVDTPEGLVVPVIRGADQLGIWALAKKTQELAEKARAKKLALDDLSGGTFTISSLGALGGTGFTPIINAPEVAILGVGKSSVQPVWQGEGFEPRLQLPLSLSYDHRVINGTDGGHFMVTLTELLGDIRRLSL
jgi:pyruvate dehydrogenase E2 component (dihydrolipoamide acetyltransferase)